MNFKPNKINMILILIMVIAFSIVHSIGLASYVIERLLDLIISSFSLLFFINYLKQLKTNKKQFTTCLILANLFLLIFISHFLRLIYGGLSC